jgi:Amt family ammonium transporter
MYAVNAMGLLRVSQEGEAQGLDLHEHGISAYPEYVISSVVTPAAMTVQRDAPRLAGEPRTNTGLSQPAH